MGESSNMAAAEPSSPPSPSMHLKPLPSLSAKLHLSPYNSPSPADTPPPLPPQSRIDPSIAQKESPVPLSRLGARGLVRWARENWYDLGWFLGKKGWDLWWSLVKYGVWGPPRPSWGIEMTMLAALMRGLGQHSSLADITLIRNFISIHHLLPLPPDAIVTPVRFVVKKRGKQALRGLLATLDAQEDGARTLSGEWVVNKSVWRRLRSEAREREMYSRRNKNADETLPSEAHARARASINKARDEKVIYFIHGGAYYVGGATTHRTITIALSKHCNCRVFAINYRLAPEVRFPEPLIDVVYGYLRLVEDLKIEPKNIIVMGDSAGGGLALSLVMYLRDAGYANWVPRAMALMSPWVDLTLSCGSWDENAPYDVIPIPGQEDHLNPVSCYLGPEGIKKYLTHPYASPLFGDFANLPPILVQAGDAECLRDEITLLAHKATLAGVQVQHELYVDQVHVFQSFPFLESAGVAFRSIARWVRKLQAQSVAEAAAARAVEASKDTATDAPRPVRPQPVQRAPSQLRESVSRMETPTSVYEDTIGTEMAKGKTKLVKGDGTEVAIDGADEEGDEAEKADDEDEEEEDVAEDDVEREFAEGEDEQEQDDHVSPLVSPRPALASLQTESLADVNEAAALVDLPRGNEASEDTAVNRHRAVSNPPTPAEGARGGGGGGPRRPLFVQRAFSGFSRLSQHQDAASSPTSPRLHRKSSSSFMFTPTTSSTDSSAGMSTSHTIPPGARGGGGGQGRHRPTISHHLTTSPARPTTRNRSQSHSDMISLVNGYSELGAANRTVVYGSSSTGAASGKESEGGHDGSDRSDIQLDDEDARAC